MSQDELVDAYTTGRISRRVFVRRMIAGGFSLALALGYARALTPASARAAGPADHHGHHHCHSIDPSCPPEG